MDAKSKKPSEKKKGKSLFAFLGDLKDELKKVNWTTRDELLSATKIVVIAVFCFGIGIYGIDLIIKGLLELIKRTLFFIFG